ncbi:hypothetical protein GCM10010971_41370 [Silvimonas amylolytica]|uniref:Uncharacterized protein n=1 Tax=Silvimonas amylolytica TaxID=449663 RepID=A0ABQ2PRP9_9NEIS|nr:hypothetical protein GCM10010971_41370 [Silvimonas amylolytica]
MVCPGVRGHRDRPGPENDDCVRKAMATCQAKDYSFTDHNCCHCAEDALTACGLSFPAKKWPNWPINPGPLPGEPGWHSKWDDFKNGK